MATRHESAVDGNRRKYPWHQWVDGTPWHAERGVDYDCTTISFRAGLYEHARRYDLKVHTKLTPTGVAFQFQPRDPHARRPDESAADWRRRLATA